jgi:hypothetical protein
MKTSLTGKLFADAACAAVGAFVFGVCLTRSIKHFDSVSVTVTVMVVVVGCLVADMFWTRREVRRLAASETAKSHGIQFLWSCVFFSMLSFMLGVAVSSYIWLGTDFVHSFGLIFSSAITAIAIYPVLRDAKRLADAAEPTQITSLPSDRDNN